MYPRSLSYCLLLSLPFFVACSPSALERSETWGERGASLVNGVVDTGHPAVGVVSSGGDAACTGTLFAADQVLTAAHCVLSEDPPYTYREPVYFMVGGIYGTPYVARAVAAHPGYGGATDDDVAVVWLDNPVSGVTPVPLASSAPYEGEAITLVGYGLVGENLGDFGTKRKAANTIGDVARTWFSYSGAGGAGTICSGDSGGPSFAVRNGREEIVGVHSASEEGCLTNGYDMRVDYFVPWITTQDATARTYGGQCGSGVDCLSGLCIPTDGGQSFCTQECSNADPCPYADECVAVTGAASIAEACLPHTGGAGAVGDACNNHLECASTMCVEIPNIGAICSAPCSVSAQDCPGDYDCIDSSLGPLCVPEGVGAPPSPPPPPTTPPPPAKKPLGESCEVPVECESGYCADLGASAVCIELCDLAAPQCPTGFTCLPISGNEQGACVSTAPGGLGAPCSAPGDCESGLCAVDNISKKEFCSEVCQPDEGCAEGYDCVAAGNTHVCTPAPKEGGFVADDGGCAVGGGSGHGTFGAWLLLLLLLVRRRAVHHRAVHHRSR